MAIPKDMTVDKFCAMHQSMIGGFFGVVCVNGKMKRFYQEFPQALTSDSFLDVLNEMKIHMMRELYDKRVVVV
jgi:hypothetical protein